ncbi:hypothetical protein SAMN05421688_1998 [Poseidonocella pacifica]|uniref:Uncharacterized protein n=1 Tax=Poseidonocella pacifica TaxID=871651 RepID=A0A1I0X8J4_9RHOB|nr:hypothetical protein [Poseidonocella pacifica]SFA97355.1 hypothetical protein SAMN05421688_1998 [Poseidonocella pacifica]
MELLIWIGAAISFAGLGGLIWCILRVLNARRKNLPDDEMRQVLRRVFPINFGALCLSVIGLMLVIVGIFLS